jgi:hypothetical protein
MAMIARRELCHTSLCNDSSESLRHSERCIVCWQHEKNVPRVPMTFEFLANVCSMGYKS